MSVLVLALDRVSAVHLVAALRRYETYRAASGEELPAPLVDLERIAAEAVRSGQERSGAVTLPTELYGDPRDEVVHAMTFAETGRTLRVSESTVRRLVKSGELRSVRIGRTVRIPTAAIRKYLEKETETP